MKILHVINSLEGGGAEKMISELLPLQNIDHQVSLLVLNNNKAKFYEKLVQDGIEVNVLGKNKYSIRYLFLLRQFMKNGNHDIIHVHLFPSMYLVALSSLGLKKTLIYTEHNTDNKRRKYKIFKYIEPIIYGLYQSIICISNETKINLIKHLNSKRIELKCIVVNNGIVLPNRVIKAKKLSNTHKKINMIMVGRFEEQKDHLTVIKAMQKLNENVCLYFAGTGSLERYYKRMVSEKKLNSRIHFLGFVSNVYDLIERMDIAILSSNWEGFGLAALESMALGVPTVASDVSGLSEVVKDGGVLFEKGNAEHLANQINLLLSNKGFYNKTSSCGINKSSQYNIINMNENYLKIYNDAKNSNNFI